MQSLAEQIAALPEEERREALAGLSPQELHDLPFNWRFWGRPEQFAPTGDWRGWLLMAGRGFGKSRASAEWVRERVYAGARFISLIGATASDVRDVMVEGQSGLLSIFPAKERPDYEPSKRRLTFHTGARASLFSAEESSRLRGPQADTILCDELASWNDPETFDLALMGLRLGNDPRWAASTTPRPTPLMRALVKDPTVVLTRGSTYDNSSNLPRQFLDSIIDKYKNTRTGRQELDGELLLDCPGSLWNFDLIDAAQWPGGPLPEMVRIVVGVDPAVTSSESSDDTGIIVCGIDANKKGYVLADASVHGSPLEWASAVIRAYDTWQADKVIVETNQGGLMVEQTLRSVRKTLPIKQVRASRGKLTRAEPIASLYEQHKVVHAPPRPGAFKELEAEMTTYVAASGQPSPDRMDALVWALTELVGKPEIYVGVAGGDDDGYPSERRPGLSGGLSRDYFDGKYR